MAKAHIVVIGSTNTDLVTTVAHLPAPGETLMGSDLQTVAGGKGANQAVAAARLGGRVTFIARTGDDAFGSTARAGFENEGIDTRYVRITPGIASGVALIAVSQTTGENSIVVAPGANAYLSPEDVEDAAEAFDNADAIVLSLEIPLETVVRAAEMGRARRIPVILNPAPACALPPTLLATVDLLTPNETEAVFLAGAADAEAENMEAIAAQLLTLGIGAAVITLGSAGALLATPDAIEYLMGIPVRAVDTVGAGDTFTGAVVVELASGRSLRDAVRFANAAASLKVTRRGAQPGIPTRAEVEAFPG